MQARDKVNFRRQSQIPLNSHLGLGRSQKNIESTLVANHQNLTTFLLGLSSQLTLAFIIDRKSPW